MTKQKLVRIFTNAGLLITSALLAGCPCPACDVLTCGPGTIEEMVGTDRTCVVTPLSCGSGALEQTTGGQRECVPDADVTSCGTDTHEREQTTGGQRECLPGPSTCAAGEVEYLDSDGNLACRSVDFVCADGTHEQTTGGQRECVFDAANCGSGTHEQTTGGQRECVPD